ncbi:MAG: Lrp/AsnC family transcriptional regulator [Theionarchaea archaeon]|nr:Lrp/AsnC family transcriptional regulator [Theionarchaea archaeon]MBU6999138.1 Lrp/AsnC family transcriptional regulator [Theionarchaea archaeon]MBU7019499.1 Lrp/AsnC family transcriptional regulator [Theionarchaea archaeon]MBU7034931.1 Lrp/AsnC family transcriptional regulator [Theionarchaea archaeon]MBU7040787.1 Lrp/AsnC family transcriptional regulator [Theionarchaea archaeon]
MKREPKLDELDKRILRKLQEDATTSYKILASEIGAPESTIYDRTKRLKDQKVIKAVVPLLDGEMIGVSTTAYIGVSVHPISTIEETARKLAQLDEVLEVHEVSGERDILAKVKVSDTTALRAFLMEKVVTIGSVRDLNVLICIHTAKEDVRLSIK